MEEDKPNTNNNFLFIFNGFKEVSIGRTNFIPYSYVLFSKKALMRESTQSLFFEISDKNTCTTLVKLKFF